VTAKKQSKKKVETREELVQQYGRIITGSDTIVKGGVWSDKSKVAIIGFAPSSMRDALTVFNDPDWEVWGLNQLYMAFPEVANRATRWFQIHHRHSYDSTVLRDHRHHDWLAGLRKYPVYMQKREPDVPMSIAFPKEKITDHFGTYFTNSISWEIALAIYEGFKTIGIWGVDMAQDDEYSYERPSVEFFVGWAKGAGINVIVPEKCDLLKEMWLYPFEDSSPFRTKVQGRTEELSRRINVAAQNEQTQRDIRNQLLGARDNMQYILRTWSAAQRELVREDNRITQCPYCGGNHDYRLTPCPIKGK